MQRYDPGTNVLETRFNVQGQVGGRLPRLLPDRRRKAAGGM